MRNPMRLLPIAAAQVRPLDSTLHIPFHISQGSIEAVQNVLVVLRDAEGCASIGEAAPFPVLTCDTQATVLPACQQLVSAMIGRTPAAALQLLHDELWPQFAQTETALVGVEIALWDLYARQLGVPLRRLWGRAELRSAETDITLPRLEAADVASFHHHFAEYQFPFYKVKVGGGSVDDDVARVMALAACTGPGLRLSIDGNQGLTESAAALLVEKLAAHQVHPLFFEQPLAADDLAGMARLRERIAVPVCADESVRTVHDAIRVFESRAAGMVNLKFMKSGVRESLLIAELARRHGIPLMIGGMVESEIAMTASLHAVCGTGLFAVCDLDTPFFLTERFTQTSPYHGRSAQLVLPSGNGLGLSLHEALY